jgi:hypothetical protein
MDPLKNFLEKHDRRPPPPPTHHFAQLKERIDAEASSFLRWPQALIAGLALVALVLFLQSRHEAAIKTDQELATFLSETYRTDFNAEDNDYPDQQGAYYFELLN